MAKYTNSEGFYGNQGAGVLFFARSTCRFLLLLRSAWVNEPHTWCTPGGKVDAGETPLQAAKREVQEESGATIANEGNLQPLYVFKSPNGTFEYHNYIGIVENEFTPTLSDRESDDYKWLTFEQLQTLPSKHFGIKDLLSVAGSRLSKLVDDCVKKDLSQ